MKTKTLTMTFEDLRNLIGRKVECHLFCNGIEKGPISDLTIERVGIYPDYFEIRFSGREDIENVNLNTIYLDNKDFESFLKGNEHKPIYDPSYEDIYRLKK